MNINFDTDNIIFCVYPRYGGGKFLKNCLGLSDSVVFQDSTLAEKQLAGEFNVDDKLHFLLHQLDHCDPDIWDDLGLGCTKLFGSNERHYTEGKVDFKQIIDTLSHSEFKFILGVHFPNSLKPMLDVWKNATLIVFTNTKNFRRLRRQQKKKTELDFNWDNETAIEIEKSNLNNRILYFNNDSYFNEDDTVREVKSMYENLNLPNFDEHAIRKYYRNWITKCLPTELIKNS